MDNFGPKFQGVNYGIVFIGYSTAAFVAPKVTAGIAAANNGDFTKAFYVAIVVAVAGLILDLVYKKKTATKAITETAQSTKTPSRTREGVFIEMICLITGSYPTLRENVPQKLSDSSGLSDN